MPVSDTPAPADERAHVIVFDTTMRDGEQSPGASMSLEEKLELAKILEEMKVWIRPRFAFLIASAQR